MRVIIIVEIIVQVVVSPQGGCIKLGCRKTKAEK